MTGRVHVGHQNSLTGTSSANYSLRCISWSDVTVAGEKIYYSCFLLSSERRGLVAPYCLVYLLQLVEMVYRELSEDLMNSCACGDLYQGATVRMIMAGTVLLLSR